MKPLFTDIISYGLTIIFISEKTFKLMEILKTDLKHNKLALKPNNMDDLWHLQQVLEPGDKVSSKTERKTTIKRGQEIVKGEREKVFLGIEIEKINLENQLRLTGKIIEGPENITHEHHTLVIEPGTVLTIEKIWEKHQLERLKKAKIKKPLLFICVIDREEADFAILKESGIEFLGSIEPKVSGSRATSKSESGDRTGYYKEVMENLENKSEYIVVAGPGFERENLLGYIKEKNPGLAKKIILEHSSDIGRSGIQEVIKRSANTILKDTRIARESGFVEEFLKRIKMGGLVAYGQKETEEAVNLGAVETLLVSVEKVKQFKPLMEQAEKLKGQIVLITADHPAGEQFLSLGGIGAFLRFKIK